MNIKIFILFAFIGSAYLAQISQLSIFENKINSIEPTRIADTVIKTPGIADYLMELSSKPSSYTIPITDNYKLYLFYKEIVNQYNA